MVLFLFLLFLSFRSLGWEGWAVNKRWGCSEEKLGVSWMVSYLETITILCIL